MVTENEIFLKYTIMKIKFLTRKSMFLKVCFPVRREPPTPPARGGAPWGPHPRGRSRAGPQQDSFASKIIQIAEN